MLGLAHLNSHGGRSVIAALGDRLRHQHEPYRADLKATPRQIGWLHEGTILVRWWAALHGPWF